MSTAGDFMCAGIGLCRMEVLKGMPLSIPENEGFGMIFIQDYI